MVVIPARLTPVGRDCMSLTSAAYLFGAPPKFATLLHLLALGHKRNNSIFTKRTFHTSKLYAFRTAGGKVKNGAGLNLTAVNYTSLNYKKHAIFHK
ncbi:MAG: hypothetical protein H7334_11905 [Ferruginibacter sp.]|nr:hypothetical protein [Ferruginibacter sp.]